MQYAYSDQPGAPIAVPDVLEGYRPIEAVKVTGMLPGDRADFRSYYADASNHSYELEINTRRKP